MTDKAELLTDRDIALCAAGCSDPIALGVIPPDVWVSLARAVEAAVLRKLAQQEPVAWRHNKTGALCDLYEEVSLADADEWAEPLYAAPVTKE